MHSEKKLRIAIDGRVLMQQPAGISTYLICALNELAAQQPEWTFYVLTNRQVHPECKARIVERPNIVFIRKAFTRYALLWLNTELYWILKDLKPDYFWGPANLLPAFVPRSVKTALTVNDLVSKDLRHTMAFFNRLLSILLFERSIRKADLLLSISHYTANELKRRYPERRSEEIAVGCGTDRGIFRPLVLTEEEKTAVRKRYRVPEKFLLFVGTVEPRKNLDFMLQLMPRLAEAGYTLLVVGAKGWGKTRLSDIITQERYPANNVIFPGFVPTEDLVKLYNIASVYVSTSINEGFGLPQLEAMNCGCPVVCPHNSAMIEVVSDAGRTIEGWDISEWCSVIMEVYDRREHYRALGFQRADKYDWKAIVPAISASFLSGIDK